MGIQNFRRSVLTGGVCFWLLSSSYFISKENEKRNRSAWMDKFSTMGDLFAGAGSAMTIVVIYTLIDDTFDALK